MATKRVELSRLPLELVLNVVVALVVPSLLSVASKRFGWLPWDEAIAIAAFVAILFLVTMVVSISKLPWITIEPRFWPYAAVFLLIAVASYLPPIALRLIDRSNRLETLTLPVHAIDTLAPSSNSTELTSEGVTDLLNLLVDTLDISKPRGGQIRATLHVLSDDRRRLVIPEGGYVGFNSMIVDLSFDVDGDKCEQGLAGWSFAEQKHLVVDDIHNTPSNVPFCYKPYPPDNPIPVDRSIVCYPVVWTGQGVQAPRHKVGVLSVSSPHVRWLSEDDLPAIEFFARLLAKRGAPTAQADALQFGGVDRESNDNGGT